MEEDTPKESRAGRLRTITPPPPATRWVDDAISLEEVGSTLAIGFLRVLRRVREWAETAPECRADLFRFDCDAACERLGHACVQAPKLVEAFGTFARLLRVPEQMQARELSEACHQVYRWADERSHLRTAMLFAEAAAVADPEDPARANDAGWMCRRAARDERSGMWYHRAFGLSVRTKDRTEVIRALLGYGALMKDLGEYAEARYFYQKAATRALHTGRQRQAAVAHHYLLGLAAELGDYEEAERHVRLALDYYPIHDVQIPALAHDWAYLLVRMHYYTHAIPLLEMAALRIEQPEIQTVVWGTLARATAGARRRDRFKKVEEQVLQLVGLHEEYAPAALIHLGEGSRAFGEWEQAKQYTGRAVEIAQARKDGGAERVALELLNRIASRELAPREADPTASEWIGGLSFRFKSRLAKWKAPGQKQPGAEPTIVTSQPMRAGA